LGNNHIPRTLDIQISLLRRKRRKNENRFG